MPSQAGVPHTAASACLALPAPQYVARRPAALLCAVRGAAAPVQVLLWTCAGAGAVPQLGKQTLYFILMVSEAMRAWAAWAGCCASTLR